MSYHDFDDDERGDGWWLWLPGLFAVSFTTTLLLKGLIG